MSSVCLSATLTPLYFISPRFSLYLQINHEICKGLLRYHLTYPSHFTLHSRALYVLNRFKTLASMSESQTTTNGLYAVKVIYGQACTIRAPENKIIHITGASVSSLDMLRIVKPVNVGRNGRTKFASTTIDSSAVPPTGKPEKNSRKKPATVFEDATVTLNYYIPHSDTDIPACYLSKSSPQAMLNQIVKPDSPLTLRMARSAAIDAVIYVTGYFADANLGYAVSMQPTPSSFGAQALLSQPPVITSSALLASLSRNAQNIYSPYAARMKHPRDTNDVDDSDDEETKQKNIRRAAWSEKATLVEDSNAQSNTQSESQSKKYESASTYAYPVSSGKPQHDQTPKQQLPKQQLKQQQYQQKQQQKQQQKLQQKLQKQKQAIAEPIIQKQVPVESSVQKPLVKSSADVSTKPSSTESTASTSKPAVLKQKSTSSQTPLIPTTIVSKPKSTSLQMPLVPTTIVSKRKVEEPSSAVSAKKQAISTSFISNVTTSSAPTTAVKKTTIPKGFFKEGETQKIVVGPDGKKRIVRRAISKK